MRFPRLAAVVAALVVAWNGAAVATAGTPACHCTPVTAFTPPPASDGPFGITAGPGGTWYAEGDQIVRIGRAQPRSPSTRCPMRALLTPDG